MGVHISCKGGVKIADAVLMPGDPLRAKFIAENYLENAVLHNDVRGMLGYTGTYKGQPVSVQGSGMGMPSFSIYATELIQEFGAKKLIRVGSCGSMQADLPLGSLVIAMAASSNWAVNKLRFGGADFAPTADFDLLQRAYAEAKKKNIATKVGNIFSSDIFYEDDPNTWKKWAEFGVLAVEMEAAALYTIAAKFGVQALAILTVSDSLVTGEADSPESRQNTYTNMMEVALETVVGN